MTPAVRRLEASGISHDVIEYHVDAATGSYGLDAAKALSLSPDQVFKTLLAQLDERRLVVAMLPVDASLDLKALAKAAGGRKASMAEVSMAERATGYRVGGISPLGQKQTLACFIDDGALRLDRVHVSGGKRGLEISLAPEDLIALTNARPAPLARY